MKLLRLLLGLSLLLSLTGCEKKAVYPVWVPIGFLLPFTITPTSRTMQRGDTLWLDANFSDSLLDKNSGQRFRVRPQDLPLRFTIFTTELLGIGKDPVGIAPTFRFVEKIGRVQPQGAYTSSFQPVYDGSRYRVRLGLIPTKACVTCVSLLVGTAGGIRDERQPLPFIQLPPTAQGQRQQAMHERSYGIINAGKANNYDLLLEHRQALSLPPGSTPSQPGTVPDFITYDAKVSFTVEVK